MTHSLQLKEYFIGSINVRTSFIYLIIFKIVRFLENIFSRSEMEIK